MSKEMGKTGVVLIPQPQVDFAKKNPRFAGFVGDYIIKGTTKMLSVEMLIGLVDNGEESDVKNFLQALSGIEVLEVPGIHTVEDARKLAKTFGDHGAFTRLASASPDVPEL